MPASVLSDWLAQRLDRGSVQPIYRQLHRLPRCTKLNWMTTAT